jgi:hypothetical protein
MDQNGQTNSWQTGKHTGLPLLAIIILILNGCSFGLLEGYNKTAGVSIEPVSWFKTDSDHLLMNTTIDVMKNHFSGLMVIKSQPGGGYRTVFITEIGLKIFDMEFLPGKPVVVHYFMEALNKKILVKTLSGDMRLLLVQPAMDERPMVYRSPSGGTMVKYKNKGVRNYYGISSATFKPVQAFQTSRTSKKVQIEYFSREGAKIDSIHIIHDHVNLRIGMHLINENSPDATK